MKIKSQKDFFAGLMFLAVGVAFAWGATNYSIGTGARMGPGYFPLLLGVLLSVLGAVIALKALVIETADGDPIGAIAWKPLFFIIAANVSFGLMIGGLPKFKIPAMGMVVGIYVLTIIASMAGDRFKLRESLILATVLAIGSYCAFVWLLKLQFPVWPTFLTA